LISLTGKLQPARLWVCDGEGMAGDGGGCVGAR
jgi:hypothetical protein